MLGAKKRKLRLGVKNLQLTFNQFATDGKTGKGVLSAQDYKNCDCVDGDLRLGVGVRKYFTVYMEDIIFPSSVANPERFFMLMKKVGNGYEKKLGCISPNGTTYLYEDTLGRWKYVYDFNKRMKPVSVIDENNNVNLLFAGEKGVFTCSFEGKMTQTTITQASRAACFFKGRFFCAAPPFTLFYSKPYNATNFTQDIDEGGKVYLPSDKGEIVALVPMKDKLYVFYQYGIAQLEISGTARDFVFKKIGYDGGKIYGDTVGVCAVKGEKAFFLAEDGTYVFNGVTTKKVCKNLSIIPLRGDHACSYATFEGKYFLIYPTQSAERNGLLIDAESEKGYPTFAGIGVSTFHGQSFCVCGQRVQVLMKNGALPDGEQGYFFANDLDFGVSKIKNLKLITVEGEGQVGLIISDGNTTQSFDCLIDNGRAECRLALRGKSFSIKILPSAGAIVRSISAQAQVLESVK